MDELMRDMVSKKLITFASRGKAVAVFNLIRVMATTVTYKPDEIDWACKLALVRN